jgi:hypothetical protein
MIFSSEESGTHSDCGVGSLSAVAHSLARGDYPLWVRSPAWPKHSVPTYQGVEKRYRDLQ